MKYGGCADCVSLTVFLLCVSVCVLCHFLAVPCIDLRSVIAAFPGKTHANRSPFNMKFASFCRIR